MADFELRADQELPALPLLWLDSEGNVRDHTTGYTLSAKIAAATAKSVVIYTKTSGITQADATSPHVIDWTASDISTIATALGTIGDQGKDIVVYLYARRTADNKDNVFRPGNPPTGRIYPAPVAP